MKVPLAAAAPLPFFLWAVIAGDRAAAFLALAFAVSAVLARAAAHWLAAPPRPSGVRAAMRAEAKALAADARLREQVYRRNLGAVKAIERYQRHPGPRRSIVINGSEAKPVTRGTAAQAYPSVSMRDMELGFARLGAIMGPCSHADAEPVDLLLTGERVAWVCPCGAELPADWR